MKNIKGLLAWLSITFIAAGLGAYASASAVFFYSKLLQPNWAPPAWLFGPVWTVLYILMAIAAWLVWRKCGWQNARRGLSLYLLQLLLNALWTWFFFVWHQGAIASFEIVILWLVILATLLDFWRTHKIAGAFLIPYLLWVSFATALSWNLWLHNSVWL